MDIAKIVFRDGCFAELHPSMNTGSKHTKVLQAGSRVSMRFDEEYRMIRVAIKGNGSSTEPDLDYFVPVEGLSTIHPIASKPALKAAK